MIRKRITQQLEKIICTAVKEEDGTGTKGTCREALTAILGTTRMTEYKSHLSGGGPAYPQSVIVTETNKKRFLEPHTIQHTRCETGQPVFERKRNQLPTKNKS